MSSLLRLSSALFALLILSTSCFAGASAAAISGLSKSGSSYSLKSATATAANGAYYTSATVTSSGRSVTMPASASFAANAASFALTGVRLNPAGLVVGLTAAWLLEKGLSYANDEWQKTTSSNSEVQPQGFSVPGVSTTYCNGYATSEACLGKVMTVYYAKPSYWIRTNDYYLYNGINSRRYGVSTTTPTGSISHYVAIYPNNCPAGSVSTTGVCVGAVQTVATATEVDFAAVAAQPITDGAATELVKVLDMPINAPVLSPAAVDSYGTPYLDPVSGRMVKELTRFTPDPTPTDPLNVRVERYQVDAGAVPGQTAEPAALPKEANSSNQPVKAATESPDLCAANPGILACQQVAPGAGAATSNLYTADATGKSFANSINAFKTTVAGSGVYAAAGGFFNAGNITGACTGLDTTFNLVGQSFTIALSPYFCGAWADTLYGYLAIGMLLLATAAAFAIALL